MKTFLITILHPNGWKAYNTMKYNTNIPNNENYDSVEKTTANKHQ